MPNYDEYVVWKQHPLTQNLFEYIKIYKDSLVNDVLNGNGISDSYYDRLVAEYIGKIQMLERVLNVTPEDLGIVKNKE